MQCSLVDTITRQILVTLVPNLYHGCISGVSWLSSKMDDLDLFFEIMLVDFNMKICTFRCKQDNSINISRIDPNLYHGCILGVSWLNSKMDDLDLSFKFMTSIACRHDNSTNISCIEPKLIGPKLLPWMYLRSVLVKLDWMDELYLFFEVMGLI